jgi:hypothetical protein
VKAVGVPSWSGASLKSEGDAMAATILPDDFHRSIRRNGIPRELPNGGAPEGGRL